MQILFTLWGLFIFQSFHYIFIFRLFPCSLFYWGEGACILKVSRFSLLLNYLIPAFCLLFSYFSILLKHFLFQSFSDLLVFRPLLWPLPCWGEGAYILNMSGPFSFPNNILFPILFTCFFFPSCHFSGVIWHLAVATFIICQPLTHSSVRNPKMAISLIF